MARRPTPFEAEQIIDMAAYKYLCRLIKEIEEGPEGIEIYIEPEIKRIRAAFRRLGKGDIWMR